VSVSLGRRARFAVGFFALLALLAAPAARAHAETPIPAAPTRWVTDVAGFLSPQKAQALDERLGRYATDTGHQVLVYVDRTTGGVPIEDWAARAFARWKVGRKGIDDGLVLFIFGDDRHLRLEVGYGLEPQVTDLIASHIISDRIVPRIRAGDRDGAVEAGVSAILATIGGEHDAPPGTSPVTAVGDEGPAPAKLPWWAMVGGIVVLIFFVRFAARHPVLAALMMTNIGSGRRGGGWGGGGFGGGGGGGGGFSGGGGSSGGGGASGSW
jgi:uncharacterized protein